MKTASDWVRVAQSRLKTPIKSIGTDTQPPALDDSAKKTRRRFVKYLFTLTLCMMPCTPTRLNCRVKEKRSCTAPYGKPSQSYRSSPTIWDHTVLPAAWHRWMRPALTPTRQAGTRRSHWRHRHELNCWWVPSNFGQKFGNLTGLEFISCFSLAVWHLLLWCSFFNELNKYASLGSTI